MTLASIKVNFEDYQLGLVPPVAEAHAKIGVAAAGPLSPQSLTTGQQVKDMYQGGPLAGAMAVALLQAQPVVGLRVNASTAGAASAVAPASGNTGNAAMTVNGAPNDAYSLRVVVTRSGTKADGKAAVTLILNGSDGPERSVPATGLLAVPNAGFSVEFDAGTLVAGDSYTLTTTAPKATVSDVLSALEALLNTRPSLRFVHILGTATAALVAGVDAILAERELHTYYVHALCEARPMNAGETMSDYLAAVDAEFGGVASLRVGLALDGGEMYNPLTRQLENRNSAWKLTAQRPSRPIGEAPYRVRTGAHRAMGKLSFDANLTGLTGRYASLRTFDTRQGIYTAAWPLLAPAGSDYGEVQRREVIDRCASLGYDAAMNYLGDSIDVDATTGRITETEALGFEAYVAGMIRGGVGSNASGIRVALNRDENILSTEHLEFTVSCIPLGYAQRITMNVGFLNPMLAAQSAAAPVAAATTTGGTK